MSTSIAYLVAVTLLILRIGEETALAAPSGVPTSWVGEYVGRMPLNKQEGLNAALRAFFGKSTGSIVPKVGPFLYDQFNGVGEPDQYRLPDGRLIVNASDGRAGINALAVIADVNTPSVAAAAFLTNLCPQSGVDESLITGNAVKYKEHFRCELDYSLIILYASGRAPDPELDLDLTKWAEAYVQAKQQWIVPADRKLMLKRFVRILQDSRPLDLGKADEVFPLTVSTAPTP